MTKVQLIRSGGQMGTPLQGFREVPMTSNEILKSLKEAPPDNNPQSRDDFYYSVTVGDGESVDVDIHQLKGNLGKILREMEQKLKAT